MALRLGSTAVQTSIEVVVPPILDVGATFWFCCLAERQGSITYGRAGDAHAGVLTGADTPPSRKQWALITAAHAYYYDVVANHLYDAVDPWARCKPCTARQLRLLTSAGPSHLV